MSKITQYVRHLAVVAIATLLAQCAWAESTTSKVISFNFSDQAGQNATDTSGIVNVAAGAWNNFSSNGRTRTGDLNMWNGSQSVNAGSNFSITWSGSGWYGSGASEKILNRYLDDGKATTVTVSNIPFEAYDVYIYCATDTGNAKFAPWTVNGVTYGSPNWGNTNSRAACVVDENTIKVAKQTGTLTIVGSGKVNNSTRGTLAAIQIVEAEATIVNQNVGSAYTATEAEALEGDIFNLTFDAGATLTLDKDLTRSYNLISEGTITLAGDHITTANLAKLGVSGVAGGVVRVIDTAAIPEGLTAPTAGWTYRYEGETALTALPFASTATFTGKVEIACPITAKAEEAWTAIAVSNSKNYIFSEDATIEGNTFQSGNVSGANQSFVQNGGTLTTYSTDIGNTTSAAFLLGHWSSTVAYTINGGSLSVPNGGIRLGWDGNGTLTQNGGTVTAKGLRSGRDGHGGAGVYNLNGGTLTLGANGIEFGSGKTLNLGGGKIAVSDTATFTLDSGLAMAVDTEFNVPEGKTLTINAVLSGTGDLVKTGAGTLIISKVPNGYTGAIRITEGALDVQGNRDLQNIVFAEGATLIARGTTADDGTMTITGVSGNPTIELYDALGNAIPAESISHADSTITATFTPAVSGKGCWMDYEFKGNMTSVGTDTTGLTRDGTDFGSDASADFKVDEEGNAYALYTGTHPYRGVTYPTEWSCAIYCSVPDHAKAALITFGTLSNGLIGLISGTEKDQVLLVRTTGNSAYEVLATMAVPNAATAQHLYTFTKTAREIKVYLDGKLWTTYTSKSDITFGGGMQIASVHGGVGSTGIIRFDKNLFTNEGGIENETLRKSLIGMMRLYNAVIGPKAAKILSDEFPYVSPNGLYTREVSEDGTWSQEDAWSKVLESGSETAAVPEDGAVVKIATASDETVANVTVNVESDMTTEELEITGGGIIAFDVAEGSGKISNSGATTIDAAVTIKYGALDISGGPLTLGSNGSVSFDFSACPIATAYNPETVFFTGITERNDDMITAKVPSPDHGRALTFEYDTATQRYVGVLDMAREAGDIAIGDGDVAITDSTVYTDADGNETVRFYAEDWIVVSHEQTLTIGENLTHPAKIKVVDGGVLKLNFAEGVTQSNNAYNATVRVEEGGVYDVAMAIGHKDYAHPIILAGGTLTNTGIAQDVNSRQYWQNSVAANSTIEVQADKEFGAVNGGHVAHNYTLGGYTLTKTGAGQFTFKTANFVGGGTLDVQAGTLVLDNCTIPEGVKINLAIASGAEVIVNNALTKAALGTITGSGTFTYTGSVPATADVVESGSSIFQNANWTGTVKISGVSALNDWDLGAFGSGGVSKVAAINVKGYSPTSGGCNAELVLNDSGNTKALLVNNGYSAGDYFFAKVSGSGTFGWDTATTEGPGSGHIYRLKDVSKFTGKLDTGAYLMIVLGNNPGTVTRTKGAIQIEDGLTITANNWTAQSVIFGDTLKVKGSVGDAIVTATTLPETMPAVTLVDADGQEATGYTLVADGNTLKVALAAVTVTLPVPSNTEITSVTAGGETVTLTDGAITVAPGTEVVVTYAAIGNNIGGGTVTVTIDADTTTDSIDVSGITTVAAVAKIGDAKYETLVAALNEAAEGATITLVAADSSITTRYQLTKSVTLNLNGKNITASERIVVSNNATLTVNAEGSTISGLRIDAGKNSNNCGNVVINKGTWTICDNTVVHVNGTCANASVTIDGATITSEGDNGIQLNGKGTHTITDSTITGATAIYVKGGDVTINGATKLVATGSHVDVTINNNGSNATGDAIVFEAAETTYQAIGTITIADTVKFESKNGSAALSYARENNTRRTKFLPAALKSNISEAIATEADLFDDYVEGPTSWTDVKDTDVATIVTDLPTGKTVTAEKLTAWASANEVEFTAGITIPVNALIFNCAPAKVLATDFDPAKEADEVIKKVAEKTDLLALMQLAELGVGELTLTEDYPMATIKLVPSTKLESTGTAKFFQLSIELK